MAGAIDFDKVKEKYLEAICTVLPQSQVAFVVAMSISLDYFRSGGVGGAVSVINSMSLKSLFWIDSGKLWAVSISALFFSVILAFLNKLIIRKNVAFFYSKALRKDYIDKLMNIAKSAVKEIDSEGRKNAIAESVKEELASRLNFLKSMRLISDLLLSGLAYVLYCSIFLAFSKSSYFSLSDMGLSVFLMILWLLGNYSAIYYATSKVIPLQIIRGAVTGEVIFLVNMKDVAE